MTVPTYREPVDGAPEVPLTGGNTTDGVVRIEDTVRRPLGFNGALVHALLNHFESVGFTGAPRLLGIDAAGREVLTFIDGEVAGQPRPAWTVARLVRACDDAATGLVLPESIKAFGGAAEPAGIPPAPTYPLETVGHMDIAPDNVVFRGDTSVAPIDFDLARPVARVDEVHNIMVHWAPLGEPADADPPLREVDSAANRSAPRSYLAAMLTHIPRRCRIVADAYGLGELDRARLVELAVLRARHTWFSMGHIARAKAVTGCRCGRTASETRLSAGRPGSGATPRHSMLP